MNIRRMYALPSNNVAAAGYDAAAEVLLLTFKGGEVYRYDRVPARTFAMFINAESVSDFFNESLKRWPYQTKLSEFEKDAVLSRLSP